MRERKRTFRLMTTARIYSWIFRRFGYKTEIDEWMDQFPTGFLWAFGYDVTARKG